MVQLDPAQKQAPAAVEVFDKRQIILQAKHDVNLLLEKSKSVINSEKGKLENLQIIGSFTVLAKPGHAAETYEIYRIEVNKVNEQLILNKESFDIQLEETRPGKLYIVCGRYEERNPKVAPDAGKGEIRPAERILSPSVAENTNAAAASEREMGREKLPQPNFTAKERKNIKVSAEVLEGLGPLDMTKSQWEIMKGRILSAAGGSFDNLSDTEKIEAIRKVVSPHEYDGTGGLEYPSPDELKGREVRKAAGTLSDKKGDCDDYTVLFIGCVKRLDEEGLLNVGAMKLALVDYYDPAKKEVVAHANALYVTTKGKDGESTLFMVDLVYNTSVKEMGKISGKGFEQGKDFREKFLAHLNENREPGNMITDALFQSRVYGGSEAEGHKYDGGEFYYKERAGETGLIMQIKEAEGHAENARQSVVDRKFGAAQAEHEEATRQFDAIINEMTQPKGAVELGQSSEGYHADLLSRLADLYRQKCLNLLRESHTLSQLFPDNQEIREKKTEEGNKAKGEWMRLHGQIMKNADGLTAFALSHAAYSEFHMEHHQEAEELAEKAIKAAPFRIDGYEAMIDLLIGQRRAGEIPTVLDGFDKRLAEIDPGETGAIHKLRVELKEYVKKSLETPE